MTTTLRAPRAPEPAPKSRSCSQSRRRPVGGEKVSRVDGDGTTHVTPADGNVFLDLGFPPGEAEALLVRADLLIAVERLATGLTPKAAAALLGVTQRRVRDVMSGRFETFDIDSLVNMLGHAGMRVRVTVERGGDA